ncbi:MAG: PEP-CTERM sorting domain-containing protein [Verrucomicrobia bacterium]|nr:PEP-CTERM sorting domain-containing protein [Verrucomicrobiota bacterium]
MVAKKLLTFSFVLCALFKVQADTLINEDFENGLQNWFYRPSATPYGAQIVSDPLSSGRNNVLSFFVNEHSGHLYTSFLFSLQANTKILLSFDFLGLSSASSFSGGYLGVASGTPGDHSWLFGSSADYYIYPGNSLLIDDGQWHSYQIEITNGDIHMDNSSPWNPSDISNGFRIMVEDSSGPAGDAYFDNIRVESVPEPSALSLLAVGLCGLAMMRRRS